MSAPDSTEPTATATDVEHRLRTGEIEVLGRMPWSSNATFLVEVHPAGTDCAALERKGVIRELDTAAPGAVRGVYKPHRGERPLWDFPDGLYLREIAAYHLAGALGWDLVPLTILRDGPLGVGSLQLFVEADFEQHYFTLYENEDLHPQLELMCAFDIVANNTDRKSGHVLIDDAQHLWGIDNGLSFHAEFKLRTVIWEFGGQRLSQDVADGLSRVLDGDLPETLTTVLDPFERDAVRTRARALLSTGRFPTDPSGRRYPWPLV
ncbi:MAG: SCO1664 family protein [Actinomycetota bacterium]|nr:SCO1664 family protein [Actinomycetota bacterium]